MMLGVNNDDDDDDDDDEVNEIKVVFLSSNLKQKAWSLVYFLKLPCHSVLPFCATCIIQQYSGRSISGSACQRNGICSAISIHT